jgi:hypothetical protein
VRQPHRGRTLLDSPFIRVTIKAMWRVDWGRIVVYTLPFDLLGDPADAEQRTAAILDVVMALSEQGWELGDDWHGTLLRVMEVGAR